VVTYFSSGLATMFMTGSPKLWHLEAAMAA